MHQQTINIKEKPTAAGLWILFCVIGFGKFHLALLLLLLRTKVSIVQNLFRHSLQLASKLYSECSTEPLRYAHMSLFHSFVFVYSSTHTSAFERIRVLSAIFECV